LSPHPPPATRLSSPKSTRHSPLATRHTSPHLTLFPAQIQKLRLPTPDHGRHLTSLGIGLDYQVPRCVVTEDLGLPIRRRQTEDPLLAHVLYGDLRFPVASVRESGTCPLGRNRAHPPIVVVREHALLRRARPNRRLLLGTVMTGTHGFGLLFGWDTRQPAVAPLACCIRPIVARRGSPA